MFLSTQHPSEPLSESESDAGNSDDSEWETDSEEKDADHFEAWDSLPTPRTFDERAERNVEKRKKAAEKLRLAEMRSAERREGGAMDNQRGEFA
jgi:hypothetical protein